MPSPETIDAILADFHSFALRAATVDHRDIHPEAVLLLCDKIKAAVEQARAKYEHMHECFWDVNSIQNIVRQMLDERDDLRDQNPKASEVVAHFARLLIKAETPAPGNALKIREALQWVDRFFSYDGSGTSTDAATLAIEASTKTRDALDAPPRNCDLYKDCNAAWKAYNALDKRERLPGFDYWLFEEAKQEGGAR